MPNFISEDQMEQEMVQKLQHLHSLDVLDCYMETTGNLNDGSGHATEGDVIPVDRWNKADSERWATSDNTG